MARSLNLASLVEWKEWCKEGMRPPNVPSTPARTYKDGGWQGWGHWLGTGNRTGTSKEFLPFEEALRVARCLRLNSEKEWRLWCKSGARPANVPANPQRVYVHDGWMGWGHWLGTGNQSSTKRGTQFLSFNEALAVARSLNLASRMEWQQWSKEGMRPPNVPSRPDKTY